MKDKKTKKESLKPNGFYWFIYVTASKLISFFKYHVKFDKKAFKKRNKKEGCVVLYNHVCMDDHFLTTACFGYKNKANYVITKHFYYSGLKKVLPLVSCIKRDQFIPDSASIMKMKRVVSKGGIISIAPAGQLTIHGETPYIPEAIVKLLKLCKVDVYTFQMHGTYMLWPKWREKSAKYPLSLKTIKTISKEELTTLPDEELYKKIIKDLGYLDRQEQKQNLIQIKPRHKKDSLAQGLDDILYLCPKCGEKYTMAVSGNDLICSNCGNVVTFSEYGFLDATGDSVTYHDERKWIDKQREKIMNDMKDGKFLLKSNVAFISDRVDPSQLIEVGKGILYFDGDSLYYEGDCLGEKYHKDFLLDELYQFPFDPGVRFNIPDVEGMFEFMPEHNKEVIEWVLSIEAYNELKKRV